MTIKRWTKLHKQLFNCMTRLAVYLFLFMIVYQFAPFSSFFSCMFDNGISSNLEWPPWCRSQMDPSSAASPTASAVRCASRDNISIPRWRTLPQRSSLCELVASIRFILPRSRACLPMDKVQEDWWGRGNYDTRGHTLWYRAQVIYSLIWLQMARMSKTNLSLSA